MRLLSDDTLQGPVLCFDTAVEVEQLLILMFQATAKLTSVTQEVTLSMLQNRSARAIEQYRLYYCGVEIVELHRYLMQVVGGLTPHLYSIGAT